VEESRVLLGFSQQEAAVDKCRHLRIHHQAIQPPEIIHRNKNMIGMWISFKGPCEASVEIPLVGKYADSIGMCEEEVNRV
jgi:hypothetical protein